MHGFSLDAGRYGTTCLVSWFFHPAVLLFCKSVRWWDLICFVSFQFRDSHGGYTVLRNSEIPRFPAISVSPIGKTPQVHLPTWIGQSCYAAAVPGLALRASLDTRPPTHSCDMLCTITCPFKANRLAGFGQIALHTWKATLLVSKLISGGLCARV